MVSSSEAGEMCTWDMIDGKCRESVKLLQVHTNIQVNLILVTSTLGHNLNDGRFYNAKIMLLNSNIYSI